MLGMTFVGFTDQARGCRIGICAFALLGAVVVGCSGDDDGAENGECSASEDAGSGEERRDAGSAQGSKL